MYVVSACAGDESPSAIDNSTSVRTAKTRMAMLLDLKGEHSECGQSKTRSSKSDGTGATTVQVGRRRAPETKSSVRGGGVLQARDEMCVVILAREFERGLPFLRLRVRPRAVSEQHVDHARRAEIDRRRVQQRRHAVAVDVVDV